MYPKPSWGLSCSIINLSETFSKCNEQDLINSKIEIIKRASTKMRSSQAFDTANSLGDSEGLWHEWYNSVGTLCEEVMKKGELNIPGICLKSIHLFKDPEDMGSSVKSESHCSLIGLQGPGVLGAEYTVQDQAIPKHKKFVMEPVGSAPVSRTTAWMRAYRRVL